MLVNVAPDLAGASRVRYGLKLGLIRNFRVEAVYFNSAASFDNFISLLAPRPKGCLSVCAQLGVSGAKGLNLARPQLLAVY